MKLHIINTFEQFANAEDEDGNVRAVKFPGTAPAIDSDVEVELTEGYRAVTGEWRYDVIDPAAVAAPAADGEVGM